MDSTPTAGTQAHGSSAGLSPDSLRADGHAYEAAGDPGHALWHLRQYADAGLAVIPMHPVYLDWPVAGHVACGCGDRPPDAKKGEAAVPLKCNALGKHPRISWSKIETPPDFEQLREWYYSTRPSPIFANWAIVLGACDRDVCALDIDPRNGGDKTLAELLDTHGPLPRTWRDESSGGGGRYYFSRPADIPDTAGIILGDGIDFLQGRHIVVVAPSTHKRGVRYRWHETPWDAPLAELPDWLAEAARTKGEAKASSRGHGRPAPAPYYPPTNVSRSKVIDRARAYVDRMPPSIQGQRGSDALFAVACKLVQGFGLDYHEAWPVLLEYNQRARPSWTEGELRHKLQDAERAQPANGKQRGYMLEGDEQRANSGQRKIDLTGVLAGVPNVPLADLIAWDATPPAPVGDPHDDVGGGPGADESGRDGDQPGPAPANGPTAAGPAASEPPKGTLEAVSERAVGPCPSDGGSLVNAAGPAHPDDASDYCRRLDAWADAAQRQGRLSLDTAALLVPGVVHDATNYAGAAAALARDVIAQADLRRPLVVLGQHRRCLEAVEPLQQLGLAAAVFPMRDKDNCANMAEVSAAQRAGLPPSMVVCPGCPHRDGCAYLKQEEEAKGSDVLLMRASRAGVNLADAAQGRDAVLAYVPERACELFAPYEAVRLLPRPGGGAVADALVSAAAKLGVLDCDNLDAMGFWAEVGRLASAVQRAAKSGSLVTVRLRRGYARPAGWATALWRELRAGGRKPSDGAALRMLLAGAAGELRKLAARGEGGGDAVVCAAWKPRAPAETPVVVWDHSGSAADLRRAAGRGVTDLFGRPPEPRRLPARITRDTRAATVAMHALRLLAEHPRQRIGLLLWAGRHSPEEVLGLLPDDARARLVAVRPGGVRRLSGCDLVAVCGARRPTYAAVQRRLLLAGHDDALVGPGDPEWDRIEQEVALGRVRQALAGLAAPLVWLWDGRRGGQDRTPAAKDCAILEALAALLGGGGPNCATGADPFSTEEGNRGVRHLHNSTATEASTEANCASGARPFSGDEVSKGLRQLRNSAAAREVVCRTGLPLRTVQSRLTALAAEGRVVKVGTRGRNAGWALPPKVDPPVQQGHFPFLSVVDRLDERGRWRIAEQDPGGRVYRWSELAYYGPDEATLALRSGRYQFLPPGAAQDEVAFATPVAVRLDGVGRWRIAELDFRDRERVRRWGVLTFGSDDEAQLALESGDYEFAGDEETPATAA